LQKKSCLLEVSYFNLPPKQIIMKYFIKNLKVHKYPVPNKCKVKYTGEKLHDSIPAGYEKCDDCFSLPR